MPVSSIHHANGAVSATDGMKWLVPPQKLASPSTLDTKGRPCANSQALWL